MGKALNKIEEARARLQVQAEQAAAGERGSQPATRAAVRPSSVADAERGPARSNKGANALMAVVLAAIILAGFGMAWLSFHRARSMRISAAPRTVSKEAKARGQEAAERFKREFGRAVKMGRGTKPTPAAQATAPPPAPTPAP